MKIMVIPDCQVKPGVPLDHLTWAGDYMVDKKPDVVVCIGDFSDMESLSSYDVGKKSFEGRRYKNDIAVTRKAMGMLLAPMQEYNARMASNHKERYRPQMEMLLGNHEERIGRAVESDAKLEGVLSYADLGYEEAGWEVHGFLEPIVIGGVSFCHYFPSGVMGRPTTSARALLNKMHMSCVAGHLPGLDYARDARADGTQISTIVAGSFYQHEEDYMSPIVNKRHWHGIIMLHEVKDGSFDPMFVSMEYLKRRYRAKT
jgi:hypothetical protein